MLHLPTLRNLLFPQTVVREVVTPKTGDIVRNADGDLCAIERVGWHGEPSPFVGHDVLQAYVFGFEADGTVWVDWLDLHTLSTEEVSEADKDLFCSFVRRDLASLKRSFTVVALACECE